MYLLQFSDGEKRYLGRFLCAGPQVLWEFFEQQGGGDDEVLPGGWLPSMRDGFPPRLRPFGQPSLR